MTDNCSFQISGFDREGLWAPSWHADEYQFIDHNFVSRELFVAWDDYNWYMAQFQYWQRGDLA